MIKKGIWLLTLIWIFFGIGIMFFIINSPLTHRLIVLACLILSITLYIILPNSILKQGIGDWNEKD